MSEIGISDGQVAPFCLLIEVFQKGPLVAPLVTRIKNAKNNSSFFMGSLHLVGRFGFFEKRLLGKKMAPPRHQKFQSQTIVEVFHKVYISGKIDFFR